MLEAPNSQLKSGEQLDDLRAFYDTIADQCEIFDPLDRPILYDGAEQAIKKDALLERIFQMPFLKGRDLQVPLSNTLYGKLEDMIMAELARCNAEAEQHIKAANELGDKFVDDLAENEKVKNLEESLSFFDVHRLFVGADGLLTRHRSFIKRAKEMISKAKDFNELDQDGQMVLQLTQEMFKFQNEQNYVELVSTMMKLRDLTRKISQQARLEDSEMQATIDLYRSRGERDLEDAVIAMSKNSEQLAAFAHELRVQDQDDKYTKDFLYGQVKPDLLVTIILSNKWH